jgi:DNA primase
MRPKAADYDVAPILEHLGFSDVPYVTSGHAKVRCHFHGERNPSASVGKYSFRCFGCGISGDSIKLLREQGGLTFADAVALAEELTGGADPAVPSTTESSWWGAGSLLSG